MSLLPPIPGASFFHIDPASDLFSRLPEADLLERISAWKEQDQTLQFQARLLDHVHEAILATDMTGVITYWGKGAERIYGYTAAECMGKPIPSPLVPEFLRGEPDVPALLVEKGSWNGRSWQTRKNGSRLYAEIFLSPVSDAEGTPTGIIGICHDITGRHEAEQEIEALGKRLLQSQKLESIGRLAGGIAHDFNNMLAPILGHAELLRLDCLPEQKEGLDDIIQAANRARDLIRQIMTFSRTSQGERIPTCPRSLVRGTVKLLRATLPSHVRIRYDTRECGEILCDPEQIRQALMNLAMNAYQSLPETEGEIRIQVHRKRFTPPPANLDLAPGEYVRIVVRDTGVGMAPEIRERIFDPYFTTRKQAGGSGLGLSIALAIVRQHHGAVGVESRPGRGSVFQVYLPCSPVEATPSAPSSPASRVGGGTERVLVVDDEKAITLMLKNLLERLGYTVDITESSREALSRVRESPDRFDLVITDMTMPEMTGDSLARHLIDIRNDLPIILMTGHSQPINEHRARKLGIREFLQKPFQLDIMARTVRAALAGESSTDL